MRKRKRTRKVVSRTAADPGLLNKTINRTVAAGGVLDGRREGKLTNVDDSTTSADYAGGSHAPKGFAAKNFKARTDVLVDEKAPSGNIYMMNGGWLPTVERRSLWRRVRDFFRRKRVDIR